MPPEVVSVPEPAQLAHERDTLGFVPLALAGGHAGSAGLAALHAGIVRDVRKHAYADYHTLTFALGGDRLTCTDPVRGVTTDMGAGMLTVQPADVESIWHSRAEARWLQFYLSTALVQECAVHLGVATPGVLTLERRPGVDPREAVRVLYACAARLTAGTAADAAAFDHWARTLAEHLVAAHVKHATQRALGAPRLSAARVAAARDFIRAHLGPGLTASGVADALGLSRFHFSRAFLAATGETPYQVIQRERLRAARRLVAEGARPLAEIACDVGYAHQGHMSAVFTREFGVSPARLRALAAGRARPALG